MLSVKDMNFEIYIKECLGIFDHILKVTTTTIVIHKLNTDIKYYKAPVIRISM